LGISQINSDTSIVDANIRKLKQVIGWFKDQAPTLKVGFYGVAPVDMGNPWESSPIQAERNLL
jgi:hypothetical protein